MYPSHIVFTGLALLGLLAPAQAEPKQRLPSDKEAWARLPEADKGAGSPLPAWARALAAALPRTTAGMLEMDAAYRSRGLEDARLRTLVRWSAARANKSAYGEAYALFDLRRAGVTADEIKALQSGLYKLPGRDHRAIELARKLTSQAYAVTDEEVAQLKDDLGEKQLVALVQLVAYANFQDRLVRSLGLEVEPDGPLPPPAVKFKRPFVGGTAPERKPVRREDRPGEAVPTRVTGWEEASFGDLQESMKAQRARRPRVSVPDFEQVRPHLPGRLASDPVRIRWSLVCVGHSPELALAWLGTMRTFGAEAKQDRAFEELLFWVVTRSLHCFY